MALTTHQEEILEESLEILEESDILLIKGSAGTGKTYMLDELINQLCLKIPSFKKIYVSAPTNKAVGVLESKILNKNKNVHLITTHKAMKIGMYVDNKAKTKKFVPMFTEKNPPLQGVKYLIIDECSMIGEVMLGYLLEHAKKQKCKLIFVGDDKQINPVGEPDSVVFLQDIPTVELIEIIRQGEGNPIITLSRNLSFIWDFETRMVEDKGFCYTFDEHKIVEELAKVNGTDELKYLAWTNIQVNKINTQVRQLIYTNPAKIELGESLIFDEPYQDYYTSQEIRVDTLDIDEIVFKVVTQEVPTVTITKVPLKCYIINGKKVDTWGDGKLKWSGIFIIHEDSEEQLKLVSSVLQTSVNRKEIKYSSKVQFLSNFAEVKYNHAITIHKSQGSSYQQTIVDVGNVNSHPDQQEKIRLLYTAVTRASNLLILYNV